MKLREPFDFLSVFKISTRERYDWINPLAMLGLGTIGVFFIYSAQLATGKGQWMLQIVWLAVGALLYCRSRSSTTSSGSNTPIGSTWRAWSPSCCCGRRWG